MTAADVITAWDQADPEAIHPLRRVSEDAYWESGQMQAEVLASVILDWPLSDQPAEADSWIGVTTWSKEQQADACARIGLEPVDSGLPWGVYRAVKTN